MSPPPKRALLSLNLDTDAEHIQQRVNDSRHHNNSSSSPTATTHSRSHSRDDETTRSERSSINILTKPLEHTIQKTVEGVLREEWKPAPGRKVLSSGSGELSLETQTTPLTTTTTTTSTSGNAPVVKKTIVKQNISGGNTHHRRAADSHVETVDDKYDTSDL